MQMKHQWNTGRHYDEHGQRMVALVKDGEILFSDRSRHINGVIPLGAYMKGTELDKHTIETLVMTNYDLGNYSGNLLTLYLEGEEK
jgi:hypothetical protein